MIDLNSKSHVSDRINFFVDAVYDSQEEEKRDYLGASVIGDACERKCQFEWLYRLGKVEKTRPPARVQRIFLRGHWAEELCRQSLKRAGFLFGKKFGPNPIEDFGGRFKGHEDGIIGGFYNPASTACPIPLPCVWEHKCLGDKYFNKIVKDKVRAYSDTYYGQVQIEMHYLKIPNTLYSVTNANTMEIYHEVVPYVEIEALDLVHKTGRVFDMTDKGENCPRITLDRNHYVCKLCNYSKVCWSEK